MVIDLPSSLVTFSEVLVPEPTQLPFDMGVFTLNKSHLGRVGFPAEAAQRFNRTGRV